MTTPDKPDEVKELAALTAAKWLEDENPHPGAVRRIIFTPDDMAALGWYVDRNIIVILEKEVPYPVSDPEIFNDIVAGMTEYVA